MAIRSINQSKQTLTELNCRSILVSDITVKKRIQQLLADQDILNLHDIKWDFFETYDINQDNLIKIIMEQPIPKQLKSQPYGVGFNSSFDQLNLVISSNGRTIFIINTCDVIVIDPTQHLQQLFQYYGLPISSLKVIFITNSISLNLFECLMKLQRITIISQASIYLQIKKKINTYFFWTDEMLKKKIQGKILCDQQVKHKYKNIQFIFKKNTKNGIQYWDILFGLKRIRIYSHQLNYFPQELNTLPDLQYCIIYGLESTIKKQFQHCPEIYRKKIILNRVNRKYNNKYFTTLNTNQQTLTITAHPHTYHSLKASLKNESFQYKNGDINAKLDCKQLQHNQKFNCSQRVVYVRSGYVKDQQDKLHRIGSCLTNQKSIRGEQRAIIMYEPIRNIYFYHQSKQIETKNSTVPENILSRVRQNSFISSLKTTIKPNINQQQYTKAQELAFEPQSQYGMLNKISHLKTFQASSTEANCSKYIYFIIKGGIKFKKNETVATKNMMIGNIKPYYHHLFNQGDQLQVLKDTWTIQISIHDLQHTLFLHYPSKMYQLFQKPLIFI